MILTEAVRQICEIMKRLKNGEIRMIVRNGKIKHINILTEYDPEESELWYNGTK